MSWDGDRDEAKRIAFQSYKEEWSPSQVESAIVTGFDIVQKRSDRTCLVRLGEVAREINIGNGWNVPEPEDFTGDDYKVPALLALIHAEVSEALEAFRAGDRENFEEELADVQIRLLDLIAGLGIDLDAGVAMKLEKNRGRGHKHGGKRI